MIAVINKQTALSLLLLLTTLSRNARGQSCSGSDLRFPTPESENPNCIESWENQGGRFKRYPNDFDGVLSEFDSYVCPSRGVRVLISNGIPDHGVTLQNEFAVCEVHWAIEIPLSPQVASNRTEIPARGIIAMSLNGVPAYGPMEVADQNAVEATESTVSGAGFWYGHSSGEGTWHFHNPNMGERTATSDTLLGYAMDGFPIFGPLDDMDQLDACNGLFVEQNGESRYQYHVRTLDQVDENGEYCNGDNVETNWNYVLGCYSGSVETTNVYNAEEYKLDQDCVRTKTKPGKPNNNNNDILARRNLRRGDN